MWQWPKAKEILKPKFTVLIPEAAMPEIVRLKDLLDDNDNNRHTNTYNLWMAITHAVERQVKTRLTDLGISGTYTLALNDDAATNWSVECQVK